MQKFARSQLEVSGVLRCDRSAAAIVSAFVSSKTVRRTPRYRLGDWQDTQQARREWNERDLKQGAKSRSREMSRDSNRGHQTAAEALEFVQISLFPTCSGALVAALVLLLAGCGDSGRNS